MATRGTEFTQSELLKEVEGNYDRLIDELAEQINERNALTTEERHAAWRHAAERSVVELAKRVSEATDAELSRFSISSPPYPGESRYAIDSWEGRIKELQRAKDKALAYIRSLAATDGVVTLGASDLRRIGYAL